MAFLEKRIPPPLVMLIFALIAWLLNRSFPMGNEPGVAVKVLAVLFFLVGMLITILAAREFKKAQTTVNPMAPEKASSLVTSGVFSWTRNPMYLGMVCVLFAWCVWLASPVSFLVLPFFAFYITRFQIRPEERAMKTLFANEFEQYKQRVPRWL
jgi:protein-S-isoprenylcysteine O-methyltransferase Ste14